MKNIVAGILAHVDAGKTTLSEAVLYMSGAIRSAGRVDNGNSFLDNFYLERQRGITIFSKQAGIRWNETSVTIDASYRCIDGQPSFISEFGIELIGPNNQKQTKKIPNFENDIVFKDLTPGATYYASAYLLSLGTRYEYSFSFTTKSMPAQIFSDEKTLGQFREATLDFSGVREIGQAFVHELFVVWKKDHPDFIMNIENASDDVLGMIRRVENTK